MHDGNGVRGTTAVPGGKVVPPQGQRGGEYSRVLVALQVLNVQPANLHGETREAANRVIRDYLRSDRPGE